MTWRTSIVTKCEPALDSIGAAENAEKVGADHRTTDSFLYLSPDKIAACRGKVPSLDGLRALSVLVVMLSHFFPSGPIQFPGRFGVLVFFAISGFLITRLFYVELKETGSVDLLHFYARRGFRLYPVIVVYTAVVVAGYLLANQPIHWIEPLSALFYFANYLSAYDFQLSHESTLTMPFAHFWSLSIEEHFYIIFPFIFSIAAFNKRIGNDNLVYACILVCFISLACRIASAYLHPDYVGSFYFYLPTEFRLDSIAFGVLLAVLCEMSVASRLFRMIEHPSVVFGAISVLLVSFVIRDQWFRSTLQFSVQSASVVLLMAAILFSEKLFYLQIVLNSRAMKWIGVLSYSIYVWHFAIVSVMRQIIPDGFGFVVAMTGVILSIIVAAISYYYIERPFASLRRRFGSQSALTDRS